MRKKKETSIILPGLFYDMEKYVPASSYPGYTIFTDRVLAETLSVSPNTVKTWRISNVIPFRMSGNFAVYDLNQVITALLKSGYKQDLTKKSRAL